MRIRTIALALLPIAAVMVYVACSDQSEEEFRYADADRGIALPRDHAAHPDYRTEWWYYTGQLRDSSGGKYGFQVTWFRMGVGSNTAEQSQSKFRARNIYFAHFTITDKVGKRFIASERIARGGGFENAGADTTLLRTWIDDWRLEGLGPMFYISARTDTMALSLIATPSKPPVLQGENGYSQKGDAPTNASMYYSYPRLGVVGVLTLDGHSRTVEGEAWMDHEFGTSQLSNQQTGWDWFALQLSGNEEVMLYGIRRADGSYDPHATGIYVAANGTATRLALSEYKIEVLDSWTSPHSGATYPAQWRITIPSQNFQATVTPYVVDQELRTANSTRVTYWEGSVSVEGERNGKKITGEGYVELTGYAGKLSF